ncbi:hypothetical protein [Rhodococcus sp. 06-1460-1B]|nr:hypothetical protein [Rhodococcus sp. 06-1460-1B]
MVDYNGKIDLTTMMHTDLTHPNNIGQGTEADVIMGGIVQFPYRVGMNSV